MNVDEFIKMNAAESSLRLSQLAPFREDILKLKNEGFTERKIVEFLALNNVVVNQSTLHRFVKRQTENKSPKKDKKKTAPAGNSDVLHVSRYATSTNQSEPQKKERQIIQFHGRTIDVSYKPSWVPDDINLKDLL
ncbi:hypothetical protein CAP48_14885 [Advenella sp. S44]|uniref:hypothetical protein n=1 Tax=Advenella sp. S44 TaxID=1982755 RepID=UPI000C2AB719|nr:hypothetical protein [Advenella sp. S44]PJX22216.1 hypothetical protein CAP48_14885 [Advenella sp. S44]